MKFGLWWFGCGFAFASFDIATLAVPLPDSMLLNFFGGMMFAAIGFGPVVVQSLSEG